MKVAYCERRAMDSSHNCCQASSQNFVRFHRSICSSCGWSGATWRQYAFSARILLPRKHVPVWYRRSATNIRKRQALLHDILPNNEWKGHMIASRNGWKREKLPLVPWQRLWDELIVDIANNFTMTLPNRWAVSRSGDCVSAISCTWS